MSPCLNIKAWIFNWISPKLSVLVTTSLSLLSSAPAPPRPDRPPPPQLSTQASRPVLQSHSTTQLLPPRPQETTLPLKRSASQPSTSQHSTQLAHPGQGEGEAEAGQGVAMAELEGLVMRRRLSSEGSVSMQNPHSLRRLSSPRGSRGEKEMEF